MWAKLQAIKNCSEIIITTEMIVSVHDHEVRPHLFDLKLVDILFPAQNAHYLLILLKN